jgi:uncharacterized damage-inducible protein DinB
MHVADMFELSEQMRRKCIDALREVSDERFREPLKNLGGRSLRDLVVHWIESEDYWINTVVCNRKITPYHCDDYATVRAACRKWDEVRKETFACIKALTEEDLKQHRTVRLQYSVQDITVEKAILYLCTHDAQTRGEFCVQMLLLGLEEPDLDI